MNDSVCNCSWCVNERLRMEVDQLKAENADALRMLEKEASKRMALLEKNAKLGNTVIAYRTQHEDDTRQFARMVKEIAELQAVAALGKAVREMPVESYLKHDYTGLWFTLAPVDRQYTLYATPDEALAKATNP